ncbi:13.88 kDa late protein [Salmonella phage CKT1]|nr:13.88 kDa late protein [Salmonella phage CKT1]
MLEQFIKLFERFVVAHELIAANSAKQTVYQLKSDNTAVNKELIEKSVEMAAPDEYRASSAVCKAS